MPRRHPDNPELDVAGATHPGRTRAINEDGFLCLRLPGAPDALLAVADGVGGRDAGDIASQMAIKMILKARLGVQRGNDAVHSQCHRLMQEAIQDANLFLFKLNQQFRNRKFTTGTTLAVLHLFSDHGTVFSIGDSRCYRLRHGHLAVLTHDDTWAQRLADQKKLPLAAVNDHPLSNTLFRCLGSFPTLSSCFSRIVCQPGDRFLVVTDGIWKMLDNEQITMALSDAGSAKEAIDRLVRGALREGGRDNLAGCAAFLK